MRFEADWAALRPLPTAPLDFTRELTVRVSRFSLVRVLLNHYSVPSRLIGASLKVRVRSETLELYHGPAPVLTLPRLSGRNRHRIDYRHLIWSLVRKPGAFANYCYREELFPTTTFRRAYDELLAATPTKADAQYLRLLHLAASTSESEVELAIKLLLEGGATPTFEVVRELAGSSKPAPAPTIIKATIDLSDYDTLLTSGGRRARSKTLPCAPPKRGSATRLSCLNWLVPSARPSRRDGSSACATNRNCCRERTSARLISIALLRPSACKSSACVMAASSPRPSTSSPLVDLAPGRATSSALSVMRWSSRGTRYCLRPPAR